MSQFIKGKELCENFFFDCAKPILDEKFADLKYSAGLLGYGSDVLGYDDIVSTDHMWGPRFYLFLDRKDIGRKDNILQVMAENFPYTYKGFSVNFSKPDPNDHGVQHPEFINEGTVNPLIWIQTFDDFLISEFGTADFEHLTSFDWLTLMEHRLLSMVSGKFFVDQLNCAEKLTKIAYYPDDVKLYLIASNWEIIASEQAFVKRCGAYGDEIGSRIICARIAERLMRLCFLYKNTYAPYSKWFGTAFDRLDIGGEIKQEIKGAISADSLAEREKHLVRAQAIAADIHNASGLTEFVDYQVESYFERDIQVIWADRFAAAAAKELQNTAFANVPLIGSMSQVGGLSEFANKKEFRTQIRGLYETAQ